MTAATIRLSWYGASVSEPAGLNADFSDPAGVTFSREDSKSGNPVVSALPIPTTPSTVYSWPKLVALEVTAVGTTDIANRRLSPSAPLQTGLHLYVKGISSYVQPTAGIVDAITDNAEPPGYTEALQNLPVIYDATTLTTSSTGRNGWFASMVVGVDSFYGPAGGQPGTISLPQYRITYDEGAALVEYALVLGLLALLSLVGLFLLGVV